MFISNKLYSDYLLDFVEVAEFYEYNPYSQESFKKRSHYLNSNYNQSREKLCSALADYNAQLDAGVKTLENIELLRKAETQAVVTGQQAGVLTGPLYTVYKAITAILLARRATEITGQPTVPIFWVASEDHDYQEVNHLQLLNNDNQLRKLELAGQPKSESISVGHFKVEEQLEELIDQLVAETYATEFRADIVAALKEMAAESSTLADFFASTMLYLFADYGLVIFDPLLAEVRELSTEIYRRLINSQSALVESLTATNQALLAQGYSLQVDKEAENTQLFIYIEGERNALLKDGEGFATRNRRFEASRQELLALIEEEPSRFSPNVLARPLVQEYLLPTLAYVGGPGEIAYHAQLKSLYSELNLEMPLLYPRQSITIVESRIADYLDKYDLGKEVILANNLKQALEKELAARDELNIPRTFEQIKKRFSKEYDQVIPKLKKIDQNLEKLGEQNLERILAEVDYLEEKAKQFHKRNSEVLVRQFKKLQRNLLPQDKLQERVLNIFPYLFKYSRSLINELVNYFDLDILEHRLFFYEGVDSNED
ncbi:bacillithiol biosynthesis cysteine-adding enzyme BshC [Fuchsiella alkaliacetigena]|uniref:bacillithiol biosynthesis cysteine-adding enzyme BshC n=1 Tax=Fuchsiella alkaliacetigena TaxID=957042 RepID=UPI00200A2F1D|nr:bacillithiol biosynthesis cysteine-adding enzyme BshC [Fuchsiella alkaliacetigena]MCK8824070.1 bacillithiol biosynthesis cysteine-adding enzyme BshC [Fuchsiella alkaliacetigena]